MLAKSIVEPQGRPNKFTDVGVVGRKTGLMVKDTGRRDSAGLEDMDAFFSPTADRSPKKELLSPRGNPYKTKFQAALRSYEPKSMSGTSSSIQDPSDVLASRKSLLAQHRSPQKTFLKSPAVRVQTPKLNDIGSPSRVKVQRLLTYTDFIADIEDEDLNIGANLDADITESPTEAVRPVPRKNGLAQKTSRKALVLDEDEEEEEIVGQEEDVDHSSDYGGGFGDNSFDQNGQMEDQEEDQYVDQQQLEDEEAEEEQVEETATPSPGRRKARSKSAPKSKARSQAKKPKQSSSSQPAAKRPRTTPVASQSIIQRKEYPHPADVSMVDGDVRRSTRIRVQPLAHWKGERIVYELEGRRASGPALPKIKEIVRIDTPPQPVRQMPRARSVARKRKSRADSDSEEDDESDAGEVFASIKSYEDGSTIDDYRIAVSKSAINPLALQGSKVRFEKLFQDNGYTACGIMDIIVGGQKGVKPTKHSFMTFAVMSGRVEVKVNKTAFIMSRGGVFVVPRGNLYSIKNVGEKDCRLFFSQAVEENSESRSQEQS